MAFNNVRILQAENWRNDQDVIHRLRALQSLENQLAEQEHRPSIPVAFMPDDRRSLDQDGQPLRSGFFDSEKGENGAIFIDPRLFRNDDPYQTVQTLFHESRHAYQEHAANHPEQHPELDPEQAGLWAKNLEAYLSEGEGPAGSLYEYGHYFGQPIEVDARQAAQEQMEQLYGEQFQDQEGFPAYKQDRALQDLSNEVAAREIGENYQELALEKVEEKYQALHPELAAEQGTDASEASGQTAAQYSGQPASSEPSEGESESNEESYSYGYGL